VACLTTDTGVLRKHGWSQPPGSRRVHYLRAADALEPEPVRAAPAVVRAREPVQAVLLALSSDTKDGKLLPRYTRCVPQAELLHQAICARLGDDGCAYETLRGCDAQGKPLCGHRHAKLIPLDLDEDGRIDHVLVTAREGLGAEAQRLLQCVSRTWSKGISDIHVTCVGIGQLALFRDQLRNTSGAPPTELGCSRLWSGRTPLVLPRHWKKNGRNSPEGQIRAELESHGWPEPVAVRVVHDRERLVEHRFLDFVRYRNRRQGKPQPPATRPWLVEIEFAEPTDACELGPLTLGYASHFGLGLFVAAEGRGA